MRSVISILLACSVVASAFQHNTFSFVLTRNRAKKVAIKPRPHHSSRPRRVRLLQVTDTGSSESKQSRCWNPRLRKVMGAIAGAGVLETAYLTYTELAGKTVLCPASSEAGAASSCASVLTGPYAHIPGTDIPIAALGFLAYSTVLGLAVSPLLRKVDEDSSSDDDSLNRVALTAVTTTMGVFSIFLMTFLFGVLHQSCAYCVASALFSIVLAKLAWLGGALPKDHTKEGVTASLGGSLLSLLAAIVLFTANDPSVNAAAAVNVAGDLVRGGGQQSTTTLLASAENNKKLMEPQSPPPITMDSSKQAMVLAADLESLNTRFFGAFWCSHCYDQKQALGKQAMSKIPYIECSRDGVNAQVDLCKSRKVPGYPTWEINGKLYPGEQALDELEEIVAKAKSGQ